MLGLQEGGQPTLFVLAGTSLGTTPVGTEGAPQWYDLRRLVNLDAIGDPVGARVPVEASFDGGPVLQALWPEPFCDEVVSRLRELLESGQMVPAGAPNAAENGSVPPVAERSVPVAPIEATAQDPMSQDPMSQDPMSQDPMSQDPMSQDPMTQEVPAPPADQVLAPPAPQMPADPGPTNVPPQQQAPAPVAPPADPYPAEAPFQESAEASAPQAPAPQAPAPQAPAPQAPAPQAPAPPMPAPQGAAPGTPVDATAVVASEAGLWAASDDRPLPGEGQSLGGAASANGELTLENVVYHGGYPGQTKKRKKCVAVLNAAGLTLNGPHGPDFHIGWDVVRTVEAQNSDEAKFRIGVKARRRSTVVVFDCDQGVTIVIEAQDVPTMPLKSALMEMLGGGSVRVA